MRAPLAASASGPWRHRLRPPTLPPRRQKRLTCRILPAGLLEVPGPRPSSSPSERLGALGGIPGHQQLTCRASPPPQALRLPR